MTIAMLLRNTLQAACMQAGDRGQRMRLRPAARGELDRAGGQRLRDRGRSALPWYDTPSGHAERLETFGAGRGPAHHCRRDGTRAGARDGHGALERDPGGDRGVDRRRGIAGVSRAGARARAARPCERRRPSAAGLRWPGRWRSWSEAGSRCATSGPRPTIPWTSNGVPLRSARPGQARAVRRGPAGAPAHAESARHERRRPGHHRQRRGSPRGQAGAASSERSRGAGHAGELSGVLEHVARIGELDLADVPPTSHVAPSPARCARTSRRRACRARRRSRAPRRSADDGFLVPSPQA